MGGQPGPGGLPGRDREQASPRGSVLSFLNRYPRNRQGVTPSAHIACRDLPLSAIRFPDFLLTPTSLTWSQVTLPASQCRLMSTTNEAVVRVSAFTVNDHNKAARKNATFVVMTSQAIRTGQISMALPCTHVIAWPPRRTDRRWQRNLSACTSRERDVGNFYSWRMHCGAYSMQAIEKYEYSISGTEVAFICKQSGSAKRMQGWTPEYSIRT